MSSALCGGVIKLYRCRGCKKFKNTKLYKKEKDTDWLGATMMAYREITPYICKKCAKKGIKLTKKDKPYLVSMI